MGADAVEGVACAQTPRAEFEVRRGVGRRWLRAISLPFAMVDGTIATKTACDGCAGMAQPKPDGNRWPTWLANTIWFVWIAAMLAIVGYAVFFGESAIAELDGLNLLGAYASVP